MEDSKRMAHKAHHGSPRRRSRAGITPGQAPGRGGTPDNGLAVGRITSAPTESHETTAPLPSAKKLALLCCVTVGTARKRLWKFRSGEISENALYAGCKSEYRPVVYTPRCPVTNGITTRMSAATFERMCERKRGWGSAKRTGALDLKPSKGLLARCEWCEGERENWPEELAITDGRKQ